MRPIKFRGKSKQGTWFYGDLVRNFCFEPQGDIIACAIISDNDYVQVIPETVGQSTGLHDKNGKEIYEGDILKIKHCEQPYGGEVYYDGELARFAIKDKNCFRPLVFIGTPLNKENIYEIIGNIHTTPELLEQDNE